MAKAIIGVQSSTIRPLVEKKGIYETYRRMAEVGYHCVEVSQLAMTPENVAELERACKDFGVQVGALSAMMVPVVYQGQLMPFDSLRDDLDKIIADCKRLGCTAVRLGALPMECCVDFEKLTQFARDTEAAGLKLKEHGIDLYYHTHHMEFARLNGKYVLDHIKDMTEHLGFELDIHWIQRGGEDPVKIIKRYNGRVRLLHLKDYRVNGQKVVAGDMVGAVEFAEVGEGNLPIAACIEAGLACGCEYFFVEQDDTYGRDPIESLKISHDNLVALGYGDLF